MEQDQLRLELWNGYHAMSRNRRSYEWKLTIGLWLAVGFALKFIVDSTYLKLPTNGGGAWVVALVPAVLLVAVHIVWFFGYMNPVASFESRKMIDLDHQLRAIAVT